MRQRALDDPNSTVNVCEIVFIVLDATGKHGGTFGWAQPDTQVYLSTNHGPHVWNVSQNVNQVKNYLLRVHCTPGLCVALGVDRAARGWREVGSIKGQDGQESHIEHSRGRSQKWEPLGTDSLEENVVDRSAFWKAFKRRQMRQNAA